MSFSGTSSVAMSDFAYKNIDQIKIGENVLGFQLVLDSVNRRPLNISLAIYISTRKDELIQWELSNGQILQLTGNQQVLGRANKSPVLHWQTADKYGDGDTLESFYGYNPPRTGDYFVDVSIVKKSRLPKQTVYTLDTITKTYIVNSVAVRTTY